MQILKKRANWKEQCPEFIREPVLAWGWGQHVLTKVLTYGKGFCRDRAASGQGVHLFDPIAPPRGFPDDASEETISDFASFQFVDSDTPEPSWLLLCEVLNFDWQQEYVQLKWFSINSKAAKQFTPLPTNEGWEAHGVPSQGKPWDGNVQIFLQRTFVMI